MKGGGGLKGRDEGKEQMKRERKRWDVRSVFFKSVASD